MCKCGGDEIDLLLDTKYANRDYHFMRDFEPRLLRFKLKTTCEMAIVARVATFYRPDELPNEEECDPQLPGAGEGYGDQNIAWGDQKIA